MVDFFLSLPLLLQVWLTVTAAALLVIGIALWRAPYGPEAWDE